MTKRPFRLFFILSILAHWFIFWTIKSHGPQSFSPGPGETPLAIDFLTQENTVSPAPPIEDKESLKEPIPKATRSEASLETFKMEGRIKKARRELKELLKARLFPKTENIADHPARKKLPGYETSHQNSFNFYELAKKEAREKNLGTFNVLNPDYEQFHSFLSRMAQDIGHPWAEGLHQEVKKHHQHLRENPKDEWVTRVDVVLDPKGKLKRVLLMKGSGIKGFDRVVFDAFYAKGFFPNPPKGMVNADGEITLKYEFIVFQR